MSFTPEQMAEIGQMFAVMQAQTGIRPADLKKASKPAPKSDPVYTDGATIHEADETLPVTLRYCDVTRGDSTVRNIAFQKYGRTKVLIPLPAATALANVLLKVGPKPTKTTKSA